MTTDPPQPRRRRWWIILGRLCCIGIIAIAALGILAWSIGRLASDRWYWSQWLLWIPTIAITPCVLLGGAAALPLARAAHRKRILIAWSVVIALVVFYVAAVDHHLWRSAPADELHRDHVLRIVHWNAAGTYAHQGDPSWTPVIESDPDIAILTSATALHTRDELRSWLGPDGFIRAPQRFSIISRIPIHELRPLIAVDDIVITLVIFETTEQLGRRLTVYALDLPSNPKQSRMKLAQRVRRLLDSVDAPTPDLVLGDFNMTRNSAAIRTMFPNMIDAFNSSGRGVSGTYPREFPWYDIDHTLHRASVDIADHFIVDPGMSRHRLQITELPLVTTNGDS